MDNNYKERKNSEGDILNQAFEFMGKGTELAKVKEYDEALRLYNEAVELLREINWVDQIQTIQKTIDQLELERIHHNQALEKQKARDEKQRKLKAEQAILEEKQIREEKERIESERARKIEKSVKEKDFKQQIVDREEYADKMVREYESEIKKGNFNLDPPYEKVIRIYLNIRSLLTEKGWKAQIDHVNEQIKYFIDKIEKDKKLREIYSA